MKKLRVGIIGMGNMGGKYASMIAKGEVPLMDLKAITRTKEEKLNELKELLSNQNGYGENKENDLQIFYSADDLIKAVQEGVLELDAVIIATPHYLHQEQTIAALKAGLHVMCDKPAGVYSRQARKMNEEAENYNLVYAMMFNQRTSPVFQKMKEIVESGIYGRIKRVNWIATDWYRPDKYYKSGGWRATWAGDGGGTLLNQCPHNLDLLQWICGMPERVQGFCHEGKYHDIEVEDEVTAYMEFYNGATGIFFASTGEAPGINRLEISMEDALLVCDKGKLKVCELGFHEAEYRKTSTDCFSKLNGQWHDINCKTIDSQYAEMLKNYAETIVKGTPLLAKGKEGSKSLLLSNAIYLSSWKKEMIEIPKEGTEYELEFEKEFEKGLSARIKCQDNML